MGKSRVGMALFICEKLDFIGENRRFPLDNIPQKIYNIYRVKEKGGGQNERREIRLGMVNLNHNKYCSSTHY